MILLTQLGGENKVTSYSFLMFKLITGLIWDFPSYIIQEFDLLSPRSPGLLLNTE